MRVTSKGQVTIPQAIREKHGISVNSDVEFAEDENGRVYLRKAKTRSPRESRFRSAAAVGPLTMSTEEILNLTRGD